MHRTAPGHPDHERNPVRPIRPVAHAGSFVDDLLERGRAEIGELHLGDRAQPADRRADRDADDARLRHRRVDHAIRAEFLDEAIGDAEHPAPHPDVFAEEDAALVATEFLEERVVYCLHVRLDHERPQGMSGGKSFGRRSRMIA